MLFVVGFFGWFLFEAQSQNVVALAGLGIHKCIYQTDFELLDISLLLPPDC